MFPAADVEGAGPSADMARAVADARCGAAGRAHSGTVPAHYLKAWCAGNVLGVAGRYRLRCQLEEQSWLDNETPGQGPVSSFSVAVTMQHCSA